MSNGTRDIKDIKYADAIRGFHLLCHYRQAGLLSGRVDSR
jgi:hypothetical protein